MKRIYILALLAILICANGYSQQTSQEFADAMIEAGTEKNLNVKLQKIEKLLDQGNDFERFIILNIAAKTAFNTGDYRQAEKYAVELLSIASKYQKTWNYGNAIHDGNMVLGRIALRENKIEMAKKYLILASHTPGSPQLNSFGPNMSLADDLLTAGKKESVIEYLESCKLFWKRNDGRLDSWIASIKGGGKPYFGANLKY